MLEDFDSTTIDWGNQPVGFPLWIQNHGKGTFGTGWFKKSAKGYQDQYSGFRSITNEGVTFSVFTKPGEITDTERLEFMLKKSRRVVVEMCFSHHEIYVEEGVMGDKKYSPVHVALPYEKWKKDDRLNYQRQAIDLAIIESKL